MTGERRTAVTYRGTLTYVPVPLRVGGRLWDHPPPQEYGSASLAWL
ncbi:hypothetical protein [Georgenia muralis]|uniref:Uncharacterized protein n=1 Tax=Georgenia muralis TaxID=154117 RepID=A0A3N4Z5Q6_9MICO|nr:hypothetical protein [Georgenia muralis]RPF27687.1 hypothetical protein EDD32_2177 [Georgenia muralis]